MSLRNNFYRQKDNPVEQSNCLIILRAHALTCERIFRSETENLKNVGFEVKAMLAYIFCNWPRYPELKEAVVAIADWLIRTHEENEVPVCETYVLAYFATAFSTWRDLYEDEHPSLRRATGVIIEIFERYKEINTDITSLNSLQNAFEKWGIFDNDMFRGMVAIARNIIVLYNSNELYDIDPDKLTSTVFNLRKCVKEFEVDPTIRLAILSVAKPILLYSHNSEHDRFTPENLTKLTTSFSINNFMDDDDNTMKNAMAAISVLIYQTYVSNGLEELEVISLCNIFNNLAKWSAYRDMMMEKTIIAVAKILITKQDIFVLPEDEINTDITSLNSLQNAFEKWGIFDNDMFRGMVAIARNVIVLYNSNELYDIDPDELTSTVFNLRKCVKEFEVDPTIRLAILSVAKQILLYSHKSEHDRFTPENLTKLTTSLSINNFIDDDDNTMKNAMVAISVLIYQTYVSNGLEELEVISLCNIFNNLAKWSAYRDMMMEKTIIAVAKILITKQDIFVLPEDVYRLCYIVHGCCSWYFATEQNVLRDLMLHIAGYIERSNHESLNYRPSDLSYLCYGFMIWYKYHTKLLSYKRAIIKIAEVVLNEQQINSNKYTTYSILNLVNTFSCPELQDDENDALVHATAHLTLNHWPLRISGNIRRNAVLLIAKAFHRRSEFHSLYPNEISFLAETFSKCVKREEDDDEVDQEEHGDEVDKEEEVESLVKSVIVIAKHTIKFEDEQPSEHDALGISSKYKLMRAFDAFRAKDHGKRNLRRAIVALAKLYERENVLKLYEGDRIELMLNITQVMKKRKDNTMEEKLVLKTLTIAEAKVINEVETSWDSVKNHAPRLARRFTNWRHEDDEQKSLWKATLYLARHVEAQVEQREFPKHRHIVQFSSFSEWHKLDDEQQSIRRVMVALTKCLNHNFERYEMNNYNIKELALLASAFRIWSDKDEDDQFRIAISLIADTISYKKKNLHLAATLHQLTMLVVAFSEFCSKHSLHDNYPLKRATKFIAKSVPKKRIFKSNETSIMYSDTLCELVNTLNTLREIPPIFRLNDPIIIISIKIFEEYEINQLEQYSVNALCDYISALAKWQEEDNDKRQLKRAAIAIAKVITLRYENEISPQLDHHHLLLFAKACMVWYGGEDEDDEEFTLRNAIETIANIIVFHFNSDICMDYSVTSLSFFADAFSQWEHEIASPQSQIPTAKRLVLRHLEYDKY
ncbi:hypothetical protein C0J52_28080 [Blattella germanica]|nr:hypothetical protein C0J52_28080 [Blattella germanica]